MNKEEEKELQSVTDLVAFQVMTKLFLQQQKQEKISLEDSEAYHQSDSFEEAVAEHHSDSDLPSNRWGLTVPLAWKLARIWNQYRRRIGF